MTRTRILMIAGFLALGVVAILGWTRKSEPAAAQSMLNPVNASVAADDRGSAADVPSYATRPPVRTVTKAAEPRRSQASYADRETTTSHRVVTEERPLSHSAAIVGGSAGAGAVIGALAGGGKGAGIGALAGGGAGLIYDRLTHKKTVAEK